MYDPVVAGAVQTTDVSPAPSPGSVPPVADHIKIVGASLDNGMLHVDLVHEVPEEAKPRKIQISSGQPQVLEQKQAA